MTKEEAVQRAVLAQVKRRASRFATDYQAIQEQIKASPSGKLSGCGVYDNSAHC